MGKKIFLSPVKRDPNPLYYRFFYVLAILPGLITTELYPVQFAKRSHCINVGRWHVDKSPDHRQVVAFDSGNYFSHFLMRNLSRTGGEDHPDKVSSSLRRRPGVSYVSNATNLNSGQNSSFILAGMSALGTSASPMSAALTPNFLSFWISLRSFMPLSLTTIRSAG